MPFVEAPNIVMIEVRGTKAGEDVENRFHVDVFHEPVAADLVALAAAINPIILANWLPLLPTDFVMREVHMRSLHALNHIEQTFPFAPTDVGTAAGNPAANNITFCVSLRSLFTGRSARGRLYWLGLSEDQYTVNTFLATPLAGVLAAVNAVRAAIAAIGFRWVIVSYISGGAPRPGGPVYFVVENAVAVDAIVDSQRGRLPGH